MDATPAPLARRLLSMVYEGVLLFGVVFIADYLFDTLTQSRHALMHRHAREVWLFLVLGLYFVWFWTHGGQTLPMKTWRIRLAGPGGGPPSMARATLRYVLTWLFILPTWLALGALGIGEWPALGATFLAFAAPPFLALLDRQRRFVHDRLAGTRLIDVRVDDSRVAA